ncbi:MAG: rhodanese-like domain-containing protein [Akkermansiaceae bacterium]
MSGSLPFLPDPADTLEVTLESVAAWADLPRDQRPRLIDCREEEELAICQIAGNEWIPLGLFPGVREILGTGNERGVVVYCHHGMRSLRAATFLRSIGVENAFSMNGGIERWSQVIDPEVPRY